MFILTRWDVREPKEASQTPQIQPRHASVVLTTNTVQFGFLALEAALVVLREPPMVAPDGATWWAARS